MAPNINLQLTMKNGVPLEHLATCAQDVIISFNEGVLQTITMGE